MKRTKSPVVAAAPSPKGGFRQSDTAEIPEEALTFRESKVLEALRAAGGPMTVRALGRGCFPGMRAQPATYESQRADGTKVRHGTARAYRCVLNSLRRLVVGGYAEKVERGTYRATERRAAPSTSA